MHGSESSWNINEFKMHESESEFDSTWNWYEGSRVVNNGIENHKIVKLPVRGHEFQQQ